MKVYSQPNQLFSQSNNPLNFLGPILFPPGNENAPVKQLQQFYGGASTIVDISEETEGGNDIIGLFVYFPFIYIKKTLT